MFAQPGWFFVGMMLASNVPYKLASDKAFFDTWVPTETADTLAKARLALGYQPLRPTNVIHTLVQVALHRLPALHRSVLRATWLSPGHDGAPPRACCVLSCV